MNKLNTNFFNFNKMNLKKNPNKNQYSPSEIGPDEANEGMGILVKNRERLNSSVIRSTKNLDCRSTNCTKPRCHKESFLSASNYLCQTIMDEDKQRNNNGNSIRE